MKERPILFSAPMVRALLEGRKTQTRRIVKLGDRARSALAEAESPLKEAEGMFRWPTRHAWPGRTSDAWNAFSPYGVPGDRLWVKEAWGHVDDHREPHGPSCCWYRADPCKRCPPGVRCEHGPDRWRSARYMFRWASRLTLRVTGVRLERLQAISGEDAASEGIVQPRCPCETCQRSATMCPADAGSHVEEFSHLWDRINGKYAPWSSDPWVWVIEFLAGVTAERMET